MSYKVISCPKCGADCGAEASDEEINCDNDQCPIKTFLVFDK